MTLRISLFAVLLVFPAMVWSQGGAFYGKAPARTELPGLPPELEPVGFDQNLGAQVDLDLEFVDSGGRTVRLADLVNDKPVILSLVYYECPMLCNMILTGLTRSLRVLKFDVGDEFDVITLSFDPEETPKLAAMKKENYLSMYDRDSADPSAWNYLTGSPEAIAAITETVGFRYTFDEETGEFAHASGIVILTPEGQVARYFYGVEYAPKDLRLGLIEASENKIGTLIDQALLFCFRYDPSTGAYSAVVMNIVRLAGVLTIIGIVVLLLVLRRRGSSPQQLSSRVA